MKDTVNLMLSEEYGDRLRAEYYQTKIRLGRLEHTIRMLERGLLDFEPACPLRIMYTQMYQAKMYLAILETRAIIEDIKLNTD